MTLIDNSDENADWLHALPTHKFELAIHEALAQQLKSPPGRKTLRTAIESFLGLKAQQYEVQPLHELNDRSTAFAFKANDGQVWWMQWTTNAFQDREREIFETQALNDYVDRHRNEPVKGEFWYRHIPGTKFADVTWQAMVGRFLVQAGPFDQTPVGQAFQQFFEQYPVGHPEIAPEGWGTSHGYIYSAADRKDGVYEWVEIKESTVLPRRIASNPWSPYPKLIRGGTMNAEEREDLKRIGGQALVDLVLQEGEARTKELEQAGIAHKSVPSALEKLNALREAMSDPDIQAALDEIIADLESPADSQSPEVAVVEEEMLAEGEAELPPAAVPPIAEPEAGKSQPDSKGLTSEDVAAGLKVIVDQLRTEIAAAQQSTAQELAAVLQPLATAVKALQATDSERLAQKAAVTPAASLRELARSVLDQPATAVKSDDPLAQRKPKEAEVPLLGAAQGGLPSFLANLIQGK